MGLTAFNRRRLLDKQKGIIELEETKIPNEEKIEIALEEMQKEVNKLGNEKPKGKKGK